MAVNKQEYLLLKNDLDTIGVQLIAVSKMQPAENILRLYEWGQRDFGENYVQELVEKQSILPKDIRWHFIGHLQSNKVKYIAPFVHLIHGIDSLKLLKEVAKQAEKVERKISVLLQVHISKEETKFGFTEDELEALITYLDKHKLEHAVITGLMGMASFSDDEAQVRAEFKKIKSQLNKLKENKTEAIVTETLSIGMSSDYKIAIEEGSTMVRIGSILFGNRKPK